MKKSIYTKKNCLRCGTEATMGTTGQFCSSCYIKRQAEHSIGQSAKKKIIKEKCFLCGLGDKLQIHHLDKDQRNNEKGNLMVLCSKCHYKTHRLLMPLLRRFFGIMIKDRYSYNDIAGLFYTSKQNVYAILTKRGYIADK